MPNPLEVFNDPGAHWAFITAPTDTVFESQYFDRKLAGPSGPLSGSQLNGLREQIVESLSAFSNANVEGGLLIIGVASDGRVHGLTHLTEAELNSLTGLDALLRCYSGRSKLHDCTNIHDQPDRILLLYAGRSTWGMCETPAVRSKAWIREGQQNLLLTDARRNQLLRERRLLDFERVECSEFHEDDVDTDLLSEFRKTRRRDDLNTRDYLYELGAVERRDDSYYFNAAGMLFFGRNPQRVFANLSIRLLRYEDSIDDQTGGSLPTLDRSFAGCLPQQIRALRAFLKESGFFKVYQTRRPDGGFVDEPELPLLAVDEAIVNAVVHRDYGIALPVECRRYTDGLLVRNPGRVLQRDRDMPTEFTLGDISLTSMPRNPKITEWFRELRDDRGAEFVRMLSEGTKRMRDEMERLSLPVPEYRNGPTQTAVILRSRSTEREARLRATAVASETRTEIANAFALERPGQLMGPLASRRREILALLAGGLGGHGWYVDSLHHGKLTAHRRGAELKVPADARQFVRFYPAYSFQLRHHFAKLYLVIDYTLEVKNTASVQLLFRSLPADAFPRRAIVRDNRGSWDAAWVDTYGPETCKVTSPHNRGPQTVRSDWVVPSLPIRVLRDHLSLVLPGWDFDSAVKVHSLVGKVGQARIRLEKTLAVAVEISQSVFPLRVEDTTLLLSSEAVALARLEDSDFAAATLPEPNVEFDHGESPDIRIGLTKFGSYETENKEIELVPIVLDQYREGMGALIDRLKTGKMRFRGTERTFHTRLQYHAIIPVPRAELLLSECERLVKEHPDWAGDAALNRLFLVHTPERGYTLDDESSPYYAVKRFLLEQGIPCQMVDSTTIANPDWKDLNLALNLVAKCGVTPWVLPDRIPDADFFVGLSYTSSRRGAQERQMGYATVFNSFGRWEFYSGSGQSFPYEERAQRLGHLVETTLQRLPSLPARPTVYFHYSARFSRDDRDAILTAARRVRPDGTYIFVSVNLHHTLRLYDLRPEGDGSVVRGTYVRLGQNQLLLSTTGYNAFRKALGTPKPLELTVWVSPPPGATAGQVDLRSIAVQMLSLTKLNWASTDSLCGEPITTKYAGDIAYFTAAFLRQGRDFHVHPVLERTAWFI